MVNATNLPQNCRVGFQPCRVGFQPTSKPQGLHKLGGGLETHPTMKPCLKKCSRSKPQGLHKLGGGLETHPTRAMVGWKPTLQTFDTINAVGVAVGWKPTLR